MFTPLIGLLGAVFKLWVATHSSRFFVEARRTGALELLLVTPVSPETIVRGHWRGLRRIFLLPAITMLVALTLVGVTTIAAYVERIRASVAASGGAANWNSFDFVIQQVLSHSFDLITFVTGLLAIAWFGMWMGLVSRKVNAAVIKTIVFVAVLPWLALMFVFLILQIGLLGWHPGYLPNWLPQFIAGLFALAADIAFIIVSRRKVLGDFRSFVTETLRPALWPTRAVPPSPQTAVSRATGL
jgi:hypothetical protein